MKDKRGSGTLIFGLLFLIPFMIFTLFLVESRLLYLEKNIVDDAVVAAGLAALSEVNPIDAAYGDYSLNPSEARRIFDEYLKDNLKLDNSFNPLPGSVAISPVRVEDFRVYNPDDLPAECPSGTVLKNTSIHAVVSLKVRRPALRGLFGDEVDIVVHRDVDNYYVLGEE
jgi:Flp pilus assembly protein TadG